MQKRNILMSLIPKILIPNNQIKISHVFLKFFVTLRSAQITCTQFAITFSLHDPRSVFVYILLWNIIQSFYISC